MLFLISISLLVATATAGTLSTQQTVVSNGIKRTFYFYTPTNLDPSKGVMMYLHGGGGNGSSSAAGGTDYLWQNLADRVGVFTVFPEGKAYNNDPTSHTWNDCSDTTRTSCNACTNYDDVKFIRDLINWIHTGYDSRIDMTRVYAAGVSKGALMSERLALEANDVIAAVASISGNLPVSNDNSGRYTCKGYTAPYTPGTNEAVPILLFKGDADPRIPFGNKSGVDHGYYALVSDPCHQTGVCPPDGGHCADGCVHSFYDTLAFWQWKHNLTPNPQIEAPATQTVQYGDTVPDCINSCPNCDGSQVTRYNYGNGTYRVVVDRAVGGGHHFPGPSADTANCRILDSDGWKNRDVLSSPGGHPYVAEEIWAFVSQFTLVD